MQSLFAFLAPLLYMIAAAALAWRLFGDQETRKISRTQGLLLGFLALIAHGIAVYLEIVEIGGINLAFFDAMSLSGLFIAAVLMLSSLGKRVENLGVVLFPGIAIAIVMASISQAGLLLDLRANWGISLHILTSLLAWSFLAIASVQAVLLTIQDRHLHNRHPGGFIRALPPLQTMESLLFEMISVGFVLLTLSLASGLFFLEQIFAQQLAHKTVLSILAWLVFATLLWGRFRWGWRGRKALAWTISGFISLLLAYFGSKAVLELILAN
jgi:ABC-type uncharacterized transport system permease subunit